MAFVNRVPSRSHIQRAYDLWSHFYGTVAAPWEVGARMQALRSFRVEPGAQILDVGIGTGAFLNEIMKRAPSRTAVYGIELSTSMLREARRRLQPASPKSALLVQGDAISLPFAAESVDLVSSSYLLDLMSFEDIFRTLREFRRILKPAGRTVLVNLTKVDAERVTWYERCYEALPPLAKAYLLGGCRPVCLEHLLGGAGFTVRQRVLVFQALSSAILLGEKTADERSVVGSVRTRAGS